MSPEEALGGTRGGRDLSEWFPAFERANDAAGRGDVIEARRLTDEALALAAGDPGAEPQAIALKGALLCRIGDVVEGKRLLEQALGMGHENASANAAMHLGLLLGQEGDPEGAKHYLRQAMASGSEFVSSEAAFNLGVLCLGYGDVGAAEEGFRLAIATGSPATAAEATYQLAGMQYELGDFKGAMETIDPLIRSGDAEWAPNAMQAAAKMLAEQGDLDESEAMLRRAIDLTEGQRAADASGDLGGVLMKQALDVIHRDPERAGLYWGEARLALERAIEGGEPAVTLLARMNLSQLFKFMHDYASAERQLRTVIDSGDRELAPQAARQLKELEKARGGGMLGRFRRKS